MTHFCHDTTVAPERGFEKKKTRALYGRGVRHNQTHSAPILARHFNDRKVAVERFLLCIANASLAAWSRELFINRGSWALEKKCDNEDESILRGLRTLILLYPARAITLRRCTEDGMRKASRYLATVRRAMSTPVSRKISTMRSSESGSCTTSPSIRLLMR